VKIFFEINKHFAKKTLAVHIIMIKIFTEVVGNKK